MASRKPSTVTPAAGGPDTTFTYQVVYNNTAAPTVHDVIVDGTPSLMALQKNIAPESTSTASMPSSHRGRTGTRSSSAMGPTTGNCR